MNIVRCYVRSRTDCLVREEESIDRRIACPCVPGAKLNRPFNLLKSNVRITSPVRFEFSDTHDAIEFSISKLQFRRNKKSR